MGFDANYEATRIADERSFYAKMWLKRRLHALVGELYVGKRFKLRYLEQWVRELPLTTGSEVLEVGSGDGLFSFYLSRHYRDARVTGLELNRVEAKVCERIAREEGFANLTFVNGLLSDYDWRDRFDLVCCFDVLEHIPDDVAALREMLSTLRPGGTLLIHVPHRTFTDLDGTVKVVPDEDAWRVNPGHVRHGYTVEELDARLRETGFADIRIKRVSGPHYTRSFILHNQSANSIWRRFLILPTLDQYQQMDAATDQPTGNTVWAWAKRPLG